MEGLDRGVRERKVHVESEQTRKKTRTGEREKEGRAN